MDPGNNGEVEWRWFLAATMRSSKRALESAQPRLLDAFLLLDRDRDGFVTADDLATIFSCSPIADLRALSATQIEALMQRAAPEGSSAKVSQPLRARARA